MDKEKYNKTYFSMRIVCGKVENILKMIVCYVYTTSVTLNLMKVSMSE